MAEYILVSLYQNVTDRGRLKTVKAGRFLWIKLRESKVSCLTYYNESKNVLMFNDLG